MRNHFDIVEIECPDCYGSGNDSGNQPDECWFCGGRGKVPAPKPKLKPLSADDIAVLKSMTVAYINKPLDPEILSELHWTAGDLVQLPLSEQSYPPNLDIRHHLIEIVEDRYDGAYSRAGYTAWLGFRPDAIDDGDATCESFWRTNPTCGRGDTPQAAYRDLASRLDDLIDLVEFVKLYQICDDDHVWLHSSDDFKSWTGEQS
jgi:hypothetical protein